MAKHIRTPMRAPRQFWARVKRRTTNPARPLDFGSTADTPKFNMDKSEALHIKDVIAYFIRNRLQQFSAVGDVALFSSCLFNWLLYIGPS